MLMPTLSSMLIYRVQAEQVAVLKDVRAGCCFRRLCGDPHPEVQPQERQYYRRPSRPCSDQACKQKTYAHNHI